MDKDPKARDRRTLELAADVEAVLDDGPISRGGSARHRVSKLSSGTVGHTR